MFSSTHTILHLKKILSCRFVLKTTQIYEPRHDKTNKMSVRPAKTQISLGIRPVRSESSLCVQWVAKDPRFLHAGSEDSESSLGAHSFCWFCHVAAHISFRHVTKFVYLFCDWFPAKFMTEFILNWNTQVLSPMLFMRQNLLFSQLSGNQNFSLIFPRM